MRSAPRPSTGCSPRPRPPSASGAWREAIPARRRQALAMLAHGGVGGDAPMKLVVLGLSLGSSWGNGHATTYRALLAAFAARGHAVTFLERAVPWYAGAHRDLPDPGFCRLAFY